MEMAERSAVPVAAQTSGIDIRGEMVIRHSIVLDEWLP